MNMILNNSNFNTPQLYQGPIKRCHNQTCLGEGKRKSSLTWEDGRIRLTSAPIVSQRHLVNKKDFFRKSVHLMFLGIKGI